MIEYVQGMIYFAQIKEEKYQNHLFFYKVVHFILLITEMYIRDIKISMYSSKQFKNSVLMDSPHG